MPLPSATQTIAPAIARTKQYLFEPLRWPRLIKLILIASLVEPGLTPFNAAGRHNAHNQHPPFSPHHSPAMHHPGLLPVVFAFALALVLVFIFSYLFIRLRFSYFDSVLRLQDRIRPAWSRYHQQSLRYFGLGFAVAIPIFVVFGLLFALLFHHFAPVLASAARHKAAPTDVLPILAAAIALFVSIGLLFFLVELAMQFLVLPRMALEDASISASLGAAWNDIKQEPGQYLALALLNIVVFILASIVAAIVFAIPHALLHLLQPDGSAPGRIAILAIAALILTFVSYCLSGIVGTFRLNWALLFYGARYPELGHLLAATGNLPNPNQPIQEN